MQRGRILQSFTAKNTSLIGHAKQQRLASQLPPTSAWLAGPKKAKPNPKVLPRDGDQVHQQESDTSVSSANIISAELENQPPAAQHLGPNATVETPHKQLLPTDQVHGQWRCASSLSALASSTQLHTATAPSVESGGRMGDSSLDGTSHVIDSHCSSTQKTGRKAASTSGSVESKAERLKNRVLTGSKQTAAVQGSAARGQRQKGKRSWPPGSRPLLRLSPDLDQLGTFAISSLIQ